MTVLSKKHPPLGLNIFGIGTGISHFKSRLTYLMKSSKIYIQIKLEKKRTLEGINLPIITMNFLKYLVTGLIRKGQKGTLSTLKISNKCRD